MTDAHSDRRRDQLLLGDEHLEVSVGISPGELFRIRRVANLAVHRHHGLASADRLQGVAVSFARRNLVPFRIGRQDHVDLAVGECRRSWLRLDAVDAKMADATELNNGALLHVGWQGFSVPVLFVLDLAETLAFDGAGDDDRRLAGSLASLLHRLVDLLRIVAIDDNSPTTEGLDSISIDLRLPLIFGRASLAQPVDVEDGGEVG